jgi:signal transduction histidine kinase
VDLAELATTTSDQMCLLAEDRKLSIACDCKRRVIVQGDRARLKQVLVNLLDNAIKYTPPGGHIEVSVKEHDGRAILEVADNGIGIPPEAVPHLFERFFRVDKARSRELGGAGLGLSIVKSICTAHEARVHAESELGQGTRFIVELPLSRDAS